MIGIFVYTSTSLANLTDISFSFRPSIHQRVALLDHLRVRVALLDHLRVLRVLRVALLDHQKVARAQALLAAYYHTLPLLDHQRVQRVALLDHQRVALLDHQKVARAQALLAAYYEKCGEVGVRYEIDEFPDAAEMTV